MRDNEGISEIMNAIVYYSNTNQSKHIAQYFQTKLNYPIIQICDAQTRDFDNLAIVFPIHCQGLPDAVKSFLSDAKIKNLTAVATYGRMCHGNALFEIQKEYGFNLVAAAYVPKKHTYTEDKEFDAYSRLDCIVQKILNPAPITIAKSYKNHFSEFFKSSRCRAGVKIRKNDNCDGCGVCEKICDNHAIKKGVTNKRCIRCLKCVQNCPKKALRFSLHPVMKLYLKKKKIDDLVIYV